MTSIPTTHTAWQDFKAGTLVAFHRYANWLVGITWKRFILLSVLLIVIAAITQSLPPFRYTITEEVEEPIELPDLPDLPKPPKPPKPAKAPAPVEEPAVVKIEKPAPGASAPTGVDISIDERGIRIRPRQAASAASDAETGIRIDLPSSATKEMVQEAIEEARQAVQEAAEAQREAQQDATEAAREAREIARDAIEQARQAMREAGVGGTRTVKRQRVVHWGDFLTDLALIWIVASAIIKMVYKGRIQAEVKAAQATETAEAESLKRQVVEARMAAMQAQVEPHFLFNTLASIDHLIETDPPRASQMQKNLIALLRASMPTMREAGGSQGVRDLGRELAVIRPYLEILKVRMEERLTTEIDVPEGLHSAEFPPMMIQTLVENAIKHGLEPKAEGGHLRVKAEVLHGKLAVSVADTGLGFGKAATAGTGVGLANVRERLQLLYGAKASVSVTENQPTGTVVTITVPYKPIEENAA
jgi:signal transduction histidine kinase